jgi:hypothetical protein
MVVLNLEKNLYARSVQPLFLLIGSSDSEEQ